MKTKSLILLALIVLGCMSCSQVPREKIRLIFETDMGDDIDDALALDMIYKYMDAGKLDLLAVMSNKNNRYSAEFIDVMNTWYGYPNVPIGIVENGANTGVDAVYAQKICEMNINGTTVFKRTLSDYESIPAAPALYRKILAQQPDHSVTIVSVGLSTNIARLLDTKADEYSPLNGKDLVAMKVKLLSIMAGDFGEKPSKNWNVRHDIPAAKKVFSEWPTPIVTSPYDVGLKIKYPATSIENDFNRAIPHPMVEAYKIFSSMPYDRPTWDLTSVLYVMEPDSVFMNKSVCGIISVDEEGYTTFKADKTGKHVYLSVTDQQAEKIKNYFVRIISRKPLKGMQR